MFETVRMDMSVPKQCRCTRFHQDPECVARSEAAMRRKGEPPPAAAEAAGRKASKPPQGAPALAEANTAEEEPEEAEQEEARARGKRRRPGLPRRNGSFEADRRQSALTPSLRHSHYSKFIYGTRN